MEFINQEEFEEIIAEGKKEVEEEINAAKTHGGYLLDTDNNADSHTLYHQLGPAVIIWFIKAIFIPRSPESLVLKACDSSATLSTISSVGGFPMVKDECKELGINWLVKVITSGWNGGKVATNFAELNQLVAYSSQLELVSVKEGATELYYCNKCRYDSAPYLPHRLGAYTLRNVVMLNQNGLVYRDIPLNLHAALIKAGSSWKVRDIITKRLLPAAKKFIDDIPNEVALGYILNQNVAHIVNAIKAIDVGVARLIEPLTADKSIFAGAVLSQWSCFFDGFANDTIGVVSSARALASCGFKGYYGELADISIWLATPTVLKIKTRQEGIIEHTYINYHDETKWPEEMCCYNPTPETLNGVISCAGWPTALAMPLTSVLTNTPQVDKYCSKFQRVSVTVLCCNSPVVVFQSSDAAHGLDGRSMAGALKDLEKAFVKGFLTMMVRRADPDKFNPCDFAAFGIYPDEGYDFDKFYVKVIPVTIQYNTSCMRYVSMNDIEKKRSISTPRVADVHIDGTAMGGAERIAQIPAYPRRLPAVVALDTPFEIGACYDKDFEHQGDYKVDLYDWTDKVGIEAIKVAKDPKFARADKKI